jgi:hypothetical protein
MNIAPFQTKKDLLVFAENFIQGQMGAFRKNTKICLTGDKNGRHAYFPALLNCISVLELLSGFYAGKLDKSNLDEIKKYAHKFMDKKKYSHLNLEVLYVAFRHKLAHHAHPYYVLDTSKEKRISKQMRLTWSVTAGWRSVPIEIRSEPNKFIKRFSPPWKVAYDHRVYISIPHLRNDILQSADGYMKKLQVSHQARTRFATCIVEFFPQ